jgi:hypothetical protein
MGPEVRVGASLVDPERVHIIEQIEATEGDDAESVDGRTRPRRDYGAIGKPVLSLRRGGVVVLSVQVAVLRVATVAEVRPETVQSPCILGEQLSLGFETGVRVPVLGAQEQATEGLGTAGVDESVVGLGGAGENTRCFGIGGDHAAVVEVGFTVEGGLRADGGEEGKVDFGTHYERDDSRGGDSERSAKMEEKEEAMIYKVLFTRYI